MSPPHRVEALVTAAALLACLIAAVGLMTPWRPLGPGTSAAPEAVGELEPGDDFTDAERKRGRTLAGERRRWSYLGSLVGLVTAVAVGLTRIGATVVHAAGRPVGGGWYGTAVLGTLALLALGRLVSIPVAVGGERVLRRQGLSVQSWRSWTRDQLKSFGVSAVFAAVVVPAGYGLVHAFPGHWWVLAATGAAAMVVVASFVFPVLIEPLFSKFEPLGGELADDLLALARRDGVPVDDVLVADASRRTTALNAYVSGLGRTRRIVVYDTLISAAPPAEVSLVVAHELGHAKARDVLRGTFTGALAAALAVVLLDLALENSRLLDRAGADGPADPRSLGLAVLVLTVLGVVAGPAFALVSRRVEARADVHSLELTGDAETFVRSERRLALTNTADLNPPRLAYLMFATHPSVPERIALARSWAGRVGVGVPGPLTPEASR